MVAFPPFISRFFWEGYHAALWTQFLGHYPHGFEKNLVDFVDIEVLFGDRTTFIG